MASSKSRAITVALLVATSLPALDAYGGPKGPTPLELAQMPKFCWAQFRIPNATGEEYEMRNCGPFVNHYCYGLLDLVRAGSPTVNRHGRQSLVGLADASLRYTEHGIKDYPQCSIRDHVAGTRRRVDELKKMYGAKSSK